MRTFAVMAVAAAVALAAAQAQAASANRGLALVKRNCAMCHAIGEQGRSPNRAAPPMRELYKRYPPEDLQRALAEGLLSGHPAMPPFRFSPGEVNDIAAYLKALQGRQHAGLETGGRAAR